MLSLRRACCSLGIAGLQHPPGNSQIFQSGSTLFAAGTNGPEGQGVYRSADLGATWSRVDSGRTPEAVVWGTSKNVYAMYAWACSNGDLGTQFEIAPQPGTRREARASIERVVKRDPAATSPEAREIREHGCRTSIRIMQQGRQWICPGAW